MAERAGRGASALAPAPSRRTGRAPSADDGALSSSCEHRVGARHDSSPREGTGSARSARASRFPNGQRHELASELATLQRAIDETLAELAQFGRTRVDLGDLATTAPISPVWGLDRGIPLDRYYISGFLERHREEVRIACSKSRTRATRTFGDGRVVSSDVIDIDPDNDEATITADLTNAPSISDDTTTVFWLTQTLGDLTHLRGAGHRTSRDQAGWRLVARCRRAADLLRRSSAGWRLLALYRGVDAALVRRVFPLDAFEIVGFGNVLTCAAFLYGLAPHELSKSDLDAHDPFFPVVYGIRAVKPLRPHPSSDGSSA